MSKIPVGFRNDTYGGLDRLRMAASLLALSVCVIFIPGVVVRKMVEVAAAIDKIERSGP